MLINHEGVLALNTSRDKDNGGTDLHMQMSARHWLIASAHCIANTRITLLATRYQ